jgi:hypothetical protein
MPSSEIARESTTVASRCAKAVGGRRVGEVVGGT